MSQPDVAVLHWPAQADEAEALAADGRPRLLLVAPDADPPVSRDPLCEWVRLPADERDVAARILLLTRRLDPPPERPRVDANGRLLFRKPGSPSRRPRPDWRPCSPRTSRQVVPESELGRRGWPAGPWQRERPPRPPHPAPAAARAARPRGPGRPATGLHPPDHAGRPRELIHSRGTAPGIDPQRTISPSTRSSMLWDLEVGVQVTCPDPDQHSVLVNAGVAQWLESQPSKLVMRVRFPSPAPAESTAQGRF